jgi:hypothetical protein
MIFHPIQPSLKGRRRKKIWKGSLRKKERKKEKGRRRSVCKIWLKRLRERPRKQSLRSVVSGLRNGSPKLLWPREMRRLEWRKGAKGRKDDLKGEKKLRV